MSHHVYPDTTSRDSDWRDRAVCRDRRRYDPELWFLVGATGLALLQIEEAKNVCHRLCPVAELCLQWALETRQEFGVWGGLSEDERRRLQRRKGRRPAPHLEPEAAAEETPAALYVKHTEPAEDGHRVWIGPTPTVRVGDKHVGYRRLAFEATTGVPPSGPVKADCDHHKCVAHLTDATLRAARKATA